MFDFAYPLHLYLLATVAIFGLLYWWSRASRMRKLRKFGNLDTIAPLMPNASKYKPSIKITLELIALVALIIVLARPRAGEKEGDSTVSGIEIMIAFDVSNSMLASSNDDPNGISRLDRAKLILEKLIDKLDNDKVGLVIFAGDAKTQLPITTDFYTAKMYINDLSPELISFQGTAISEAMTMALKSYSPAEDVHKAMILITDAEDHEGDAIEIAKSAAEQGIQVNVVGVGTSKGAPIPVKGKKGEYMRDMNGNVVTTAIDEKTALAIAEAGKGIYVNGTSNSALNDLVKQLDTLGKSEFKRVSYKASAEQFPTFAWIALIFLIIDIFILDRKIGWLKDVNFFTK